MPPKSKVPKEWIVSAALDIVRQNGLDAVNARSVAAALGCSTQPVFSNFPSMECLKTAVIRQATEIYRDYLERATENEQCTPYKARGMAYIRFAKEESELFQLLYMSRRREGMPDDGDWDASIDVLMGYNGISPETAKRVQFEMWMFVHGIAAMVATGYMSFSEQEIGDLLSDAFLALKERHWPTAQEG